MARPRDPDLDGRILDAAAAIAAADGIDAVSMAEVADRAGVGRPTVYRRFPNRAALVFELQLLAVVPVELPDTGSVREDLRLAMEHLFASITHFDRTLHGERLALMASDREFAEHVWQERWIDDRDAVKVIWDRGVARGELDPTVDGAEVITDLVSAVVFRFLFWHRTDTDWIEGYVDRVCRGARPTP